MAAVRDGVDVDMTGVLLAAADLKLIRSRLQPEMRQATSKSAMNIRNGARARWTSMTSGRTTGKYPATITMEVTVANASMVRAEIGPEKGKIGSLGHIFEFGTSRSGGKPHLVPAWEAEVDPYTLAMAVAADRAVFGP